MIIASADFQALLAKIDSATGPDIRIDREVARLAYPTTPDLGLRQVSDPEPYTSDEAGAAACMRLVKRMLPGFMWAVGFEYLKAKGDAPCYWGAVFNGDKDAYELELSIGSTAGLAFLGAILKALIAKGDAA